MIQMGFRSRWMMFARSLGWRRRVEHGFSSHWQANRRITQILL
jgi:hypothetical protein